MAALTSSCGIQRLRLCWGIGALERLHQRSHAECSDGGMRSPSGIQFEHQMKHEKYPGWMALLGSYTTWVIGGYEQIQTHSREIYQPTRMTWDGWYFNGSIFWFGLLWIAVGFCVFFLHELGTCRRSVFASAEVGCMTPNMDMSHLLRHVRHVTLWWTNILPWKDPPSFVGKSTIFMAIFNCKLLVHQRVDMFDSWLTRCFSPWPYGFVWKCCVPHCTQWFCWSLSRF